MGTLIIVFIALLAIASGSLLTYFVIERLPLLTRLCAGSVVGLAGLSWAGYLISLPLGLNAVSIGATVAVFAVGLVAILRSVTPARVRDEVKTTRLTGSGLIYYAAWGVLLAWLFGRVVMFYPDGMHTAPANNFGDLPFHFSVITSFAYGENLPPQNPIFAGIGFTYPFLIDFLTAFFIRCGADWRSAFFVENLVLGLALVGLIDLMAMRMTGNRIAARFAPVIFLFNGGLGFINLFRDLGQLWSDPERLKNGLAGFFAHLPGTYTMNADLDLFSSKIPLRWGNLFTTLLIPQRSLLFGIPLVAIIITLWWMAVNDAAENGQESDRRRYLLAAGILTGLLPMLHAHGFFAVAVASVAMVLAFPSKGWIFFFVPVAVLAGPQALWLSRTQVRNKLFELNWWWEAGESNPLIFWAVNAGVFLILLIAALDVHKVIESRLRRFYLPFLLWFIIPNVVLLAPWAWDNIKVLVYWSLASSPLVAAMLAYIFARQSVILRALAAVLLIVLTLSGALDVGRALSPVENAALFGEDQLEVGAMLRQKTPPHSVILHAPIHNSVVALSGRRSVMGYPGHLWTHGIDYRQREVDVNAIYRGGPVAREALSRLNIDYLIIGPYERSSLSVDEKYFADQYPLVIDRRGYHVYQIRR